MRFRRCPVNLICQKQLSKHGARTKEKFLLLDIKNRSAGNIRRHQISRELNATKLASQHLPQRPYKQGLSQSRDALNQHMATGKEGNQCPQHQLILSNVDLAQFGNNPIKQDFGGCLLGLILSGIPNETFQVCSHLNMVFRGGLTRKVSCRCFVCTVNSTPCCGGTPSERRRLSLRLT